MMRNVISQYSQKTESELLGYFGLIKTWGSVAARWGELQGVQSSVA
jgi:hypothetical protein